MIKPSLEGVVEAQTVDVIPAMVYVILNELIFCMIWISTLQLNWSWPLLMSDLIAVIITLAWLMGVIDCKVEHNWKMGTSESGTLWKWTLEKLALLLFGLRVTKVHFNKVLGWPWSVTPEEDGEVTLAWINI